MVTCLLAKGVDSLLAYFLSALMPGKRPIPSLTKWARSSGCVQGRTQRPLQLMAEQELREISAPKSSADYSNSYARRERDVHCMDLMGPHLPTPIRGIVVFVTTRKVCRGCS